MAGNSTWRAKRDPLFRGDGVTLSAVDPKASPSIVRHVLYLGGAGRPTPYHSATEEREVAAHFAAPTGRVFRAEVKRVHAAGAKHVSRLELLGLLTGKGKGAAAWSSVYEVMRAKAYVEQWGEHLISYVDLPNAGAAAQAAASIFV